MIGEVDLLINATSVGLSEWRFARTGRRLVLAEVVRVRHDLPAGGNGIVADAADGAGAQSRTD